jgi:hypothetical protein
VDFYKTLLHLDSIDSQASYMASLSETVILGFFVKHSSEYLFKLGCWYNCLMNLELTSCLSADINFYTPYTDLVKSSFPFLHTNSQGMA